MIGAGTNVITMSYWGERGTDRWLFYAPMQTSTYAHDELFDATMDKNVLIMPTIESADASDKMQGGQSEAYHFRNDFPGTPSNPAPQLVSQIVDLVNRYLKAPATPAWGGKWARMYNRSGVRCMRCTSCTWPPRCRTPIVNSPMASTRLRQK